jgi:ubiquinone/menaquinone biosynthesis C-methylase UbiE
MHKEDGTQSRPPSVEASLYDETYYLEGCEGYEQFVATQGRVLSDRLRLVIDFLDVRPGMRVLDIGCGRGELLIWLHRQGVEAWGIDYAYAALNLAKKTLGIGDALSLHDYRLAVANARRLPFSSQLFDRVLMLDIVEHLHPWELAVVCGEVARVLKPDGKFIIHTAPNLWYYRFGYPIFRLFERLRGVHLPQNPRQRFAYHELMHVNEQSPLSLRQMLHKHGFKTRVYLLSQPLTGARMSLTARAARCVQQIPLLRLIFRNHLVAIARYDG